MLPKKSHTARTHACHSSFLAAIKVFLLQSRSVQRTRNTSVTDRIGVEEEEEEEREISVQTEGEMKMVNDSRS